ncbi:MAG: hydroxymethylbilane synthase [Cellulophaga sp.]|uniref:hydroxymethylbilane synthase n=1 Tax=unclassified Cellulophaga TaxID=2634405 RepID=UPI0026E2DC0E|nr:MULTISPECIES: hydroxymethylbilane synthase [unclassified Cellulophaga]MDO6489927.1 hydroxymethylbilane synthase [Cellulophaga sp. 2_MG-2023]MDO6494879.1 hydroxymethylbilane synthase [Cellulophaga sp. 3_MG-2023]
MSKIIRIGTRDSELALYQANRVKSELEKLGHKAKIVAVKSTGDLELDKPLYELGITGIFTRTLDIAMLKGDVDIAVHSLKDVPTVLPKGIVQAAVLERGNVKDTLVYKNNEEFLGARDGVIATSSLRRKAQWLNRYPTHRVEDIRGNVNTRLQKLEDSETWHGAIFAAAGIGRLDLRPEEAVNLDWMVPAPGQGAIMVAAREIDEDILAICSEINHEETEICTTIERTFLNKLEGGCTAPIGALAYIKNEQVVFRVVLLSPDGSKKIETDRVVKLGKHQDLAETIAEFVLERGGKYIMEGLHSEDKKTTVYSTKLLTNDQKDRFTSGITVESNDFIKINSNRIAPRFFKNEIENVVFTSKNAVESVITNYAGSELQFKNIYCVGRKTRRFIKNNIGPVAHFEKSATELAHYLADNLDTKEVTYFSGNLRLDDLPTILEKNNIKINEIEAYQTKFDTKKAPDSVESVLFYSPSGIESFLKENKANAIAFCIGDTTAAEAKKHFSDVRVAKLPTVESVIDLVNEHYS